MQSRKDSDTPAAPPLTTTTSTNSSGPPFWKRKTSHRQEEESSQSVSEPTSSRSFVNRLSLRNSRTLQILRGAMGLRNQDYVSDSAESYSNRPTKTSSMRNTTAYPGMQQQQQQQQQQQVVQLNFWQRLCHSCSGCCHPEQAVLRKNRIWLVLNSTAWKAVMSCFTIILLFGAQVRVLWIPKEYDVAVDVIFLLIFCFFTIDIILRIDAEASYFHFYLFGCVGYSSGASELQDPITQSPCGPMHFGSFLFLCDVVSTLVLLREMYFLGFERQAEIAIRLDGFSMPMSIDGRGHVNEAFPIEYNAMDLLAIIGKSARVARVIRSSAAVKWSSKVNWFMLLNMLNPLWWLSRGCDKAKGYMQQRRRRSGVPAEITAGHNHINRRASWTDIIFASKYKNALAPEERAPSKKGFVGVFRSALQGLGLLKDDEEAFRRHRAATKIQRAWRRERKKHHHAQGYNSSDDDVAWDGGKNAKKFRPRSFLQRNAPQASNKVAARDESSSNDVPKRRRNESQVGSAMRELTGQRVALGIIIALVFTVLLTYSENSFTRPSTMIILHSQTEMDDFADRSLQAAKNTSVPDMFSYFLANGENRTYPLDDDFDPNDLREREILRITVSGTNGTTTRGYFSYKSEQKEKAWVSILSTIFVLLVWFFGVTSFAGPVMVLVVIPIERMVRLLEMLMRDPLGYQSTSRFKKFLLEGDAITKNTHWTKEVLKGMETSFLMSTILRIGSLMKVGFGSAGVEIIRRNLQRGQTRNMLILSEQGSTVSCIFLFSDIRQFTDATECLQEEVFVFTNRIAAVVHSICHSFGGSANKNIGDAFLLSWLLDDNGEARHNQADKALLSVVRICVALHHDEYYVEPMTDVAREALLSKLSNRKGPIVQMGFGLHAGTAVQGAIGSTRKIDATYVSEAVERAEYLESSTKKYGLKMLVSDSFHKLLHPNNRRRCRKIDQILIRDDDDEENDGEPEGEKIELLTYDMDIEALWRDVIPVGGANKSIRSDGGRDSDSDWGSEKGSRRSGIQGVNPLRQSGTMKGGASRRRSRRLLKDFSDDFSDGNFTKGGVAAAVAPADHTEVDNSGPPELVLPTGPALYNANDWVNPEMRKMRNRYTDGIVFKNFNEGLQAFYGKDWETAKQCFVTILNLFEDGPSRYFLNQIEKHRGRPPRNFLPYAVE